MTWPEALFYCVAILGLLAFLAILARTPKAPATHEPPIPAPTWTSGPTRCPRHGVCLHARVDETGREGEK